MPRSRLLRRERHQPLHGRPGLHRYCARETRAGLVVGWAAAIAITVFSLISFGMGTLTLPMAVLMIVAAARTPRPGATPTT